MRMRYAAVAGQFYEGSRARLAKQIEGCYLHRLGPGSLPEVRDGPRTIKGIVSPHAGYMYSGPVAAHGFHALAADGLPESFVILGPNHTGLGAAVALGTYDWGTPLGTARYDAELGASMRDGLVQEDIVAHRFEHSIEVQLPFLQHLREKVRFVPICLGSQDERTATKVGQVVGEAIRGKDVIVIASTDFSHYVPKDVAARKDRLAIDEILKCDVKSFNAVVTERDISMCGYGPVTAMLTAVGPGNTELLRYGSSGDVAEMRDVVGYASILIRS